jgi:hypothetical protein
MVELPLRIPDATFPQLVLLPKTDDVLAIWTGSDHVTWTQRTSFDGVLRGSPARAGQVTSGDELLARDPLPVALPSGDVVLIGLLADGRIAYARGSSVGSRRVGPQALLQASKESVVGLATAATASGGVAVLVLRSTATTLKGTMSAALHWFEADMQEARKSIEWRTANGFEPRLRSCDGVSYIAWQTLESIVALTVDAAGARSKEVPITGASRRALRVRSHRVRRPRCLSAREQEGEELHGRGA